MDTYSPAQAAGELGTSVHRIQRAVLALGIPSTAERHRFTQAQLAELRRHLGFAPHVPGRSREELFVLAALNRRPLGVRSVRALARAASVSPTTAGKALRSLVAEGLVNERTRRLVEGGALDASVIEIARDAPAWAAIAPAVREVVVPTRNHDEAPATTVPHRLWHHFWNGDPATIRLPRDSDYVAARLLRSDDPQAFAWTASHLDPASIRKAAGLRGLGDKERSMIMHLAGDLPTRPRRPDGDRTPPAADRGSR